MSKRGALASATSPARYKACIVNVAEPTTYFLADSKNDSVCAEHTDRYSLIVRRAENSQMENRALAGARKLER